MKSVSMHGARTAARRIPLRPRAQQAFEGGFLGVGRGNALRPITKQGGAGLGKGAREQS